MKYRHINCMRSPANATSWDRFMSLLAMKHRQ